MRNHVLIKPTNLVHGANLISRYLRYCVVPYGLAYRFGPEPDNKPKPLPVGIALLCLLPLPGLALMQMMSEVILSKVDRQSYEYKAIAASSFVWRLAQVLRFYRVIVVVVNLLISLKQHGRIANVIACKCHYLTKREQSYFAKKSFAFFYLNSLANTFAYSIAIIFILKNQFSDKPLYSLFLLTISSFMFWIRLTNCGTLVYTCYVSCCLGRHVQSFSAKYTDSMFDQFMETIASDESRESSRGPQVKSSEPNRDWNNHFGARQRTRQLPTSSIQRASVLARLFRGVRRLTIRLSSRRYPELPEMKMSKLSSTTEIRISEGARRANDYLIRDRLRRTQTMIGDMRDLVSDINKTSSAIIIMYILFEALLLVFIITTSVQARVFRSLNILIMPSISVTISVVTSVVCVCIFYEEASKQLKLLTNKLFDFIIMNHRAESNETQSDGASGSSSYKASDGITLNETWEQFQYTRKLADTVQLTMGGIFPITRRVVLSVLGHVLSATFISIEIMSIMDTLDMPKATKHANHYNTTGHHHRLHPSKLDIL